MYSGESGLVVVASSGGLVLNASRISPLGSIATVCTPLDPGVEVATGVVRLRRLITLGGTSIPLRFIL